MHLASSLAHMMAEYIEEARKRPPEWSASITDLTMLFDRRIARYISADKISMILSEDAALQNGMLNTGFLAVKIAETCEGKQMAKTASDKLDREERFGIPVALARLADSIFEGLPVDLARQWPERLMSTIRPGQDLSRVSWRLLHWILTTPDVNPGITHPLVSSAVKQCADVIADLAAGKEPDKSAAWSAESAAWSAESAAWSAAWSAASAAWSAESAAWSAASAESAESAAWIKISDKLIEIIENT